MPTWFSTLGVAGLLQAVGLYIPVTAHVVRRLSRLRQFDGTADKSVRSYIAAVLNPRARSLY